MSTGAETGLQQRTGYTDIEQSGGYVNEKGFGGPTQAQGNYQDQGNYQGQGNYQVQGNYQNQGAYPVQQSYAPHTHGTYQGQPIGPNEYVDKKGRVKRRRIRGGKFAACLALCWCCTWPCHGPCCGGI